MTILEPLMADVIFVGAGPVGLYTAIQIKLYCPELHIKMYEKHEEYQRKHVLIIDKSSYKGSHEDSAFQSMLKKLEGKVPTNVIEEQLLQFARDIGIEIDYKQVTSTTYLAQTHKEATVFIGADGSHSLVRKEIFDDKKTVEEDLQYIAELKYKIEGKSRALSNFMEYLPALTLSNHFVSEFIGKERAGESAISLRFFVDADTYHEMRELGVTFKTPLDIERIKTIQTPGIQKLSTSIQRWLVARQDFAKDRIVKDSDKLTVVNLPVYRSEKFATEKDKNTWLNVGDAAMGVPYFRALNAGLISGNTLAKLMYMHFHPQPMARRSKIGSYSKVSLSMERPFSLIERYNHEMSKIANREISNARWKDTGLNIAQSSVHTSQKVPVSAYKLPRHTRHDMKAIDHDGSQKGSCSIL